jgi:hypothetical protein
LAVLPGQELSVRITPKESDPRTYKFRLMKGQELACTGCLKVAV